MSLLPLITAPTPTTNDFAWDEDPPEEVVPDPGYLFDGVDDFVPPLTSLPVFDDGEVEEVVEPEPLPDEPFASPVVALQVFDEDLYEEIQESLNSDIEESPLVTSALSTPIPDEDQYEEAPEAVAVEEDVVSTALSSTIPDEDDLELAEAEFSGQLDEDPLVTTAEGVWIDIETPAEEEVSEEFPEDDLSPPTITVWVDEPEPDLLDEQPVSIEGEDTLESPAVSTLALDDDADVDTGIEIDFDYDDGFVPVEEVAPPPPPPPLPEPTPGPAGNPSSGVSGGYFHDAPDPCVEYVGVWTKEMNQLAELCEEETATSDSDSFLSPFKDMLDAGPAAVLDLFNKKRKR